MKVRHYTIASKQSQLQCSCFDEIIFEAIAPPFSLETLPAS